jgi:hypothetical protein
MVLLLPEKKLLSFKDSALPSNMFPYLPWYYDLG